MEFVFFENIISVSGIELFYICPQVLMDIIRVFLFFWFSSRKPQSQQKLAEKITRFTIQFRSKNLILRTSTHLTLKIINSHNAAKDLSHLTDFPANIFLFGVRKTFALHHFLTPKNCILEVLWKLYISVYFCTSL